jgi:hypothetical protein
MQAAGRRQAVVIQTGKQASRQAGKQASRQASRPTCRQAPKSYVTCSYARLWPHPISTKCIMNTMMLSLVADRGEQTNNIGKDYKYQLEFISYL